MEELYIQKSSDLPNNNLIFIFELHIEYEVATEWPLIKADENLSVELWDSDRHSADEFHVSKLAGMEADSTMLGELHWEVLVNSGLPCAPMARVKLRLMSSRTIQN